MLKRRKVKGSEEVKVSFILDGKDSRLPATVVGDFNDWNEVADPFVRRSNGSYSAVVSLRTGSAVKFRYRSADGTWSNDEAADRYEQNLHGSTDCIVVV